MEHIANKNSYFRFGLVLFISSLTTANLQQVMKVFSITRIALSKFKTCKIAVGNESFKNRKQIRCCAASPKPTTLTAQMIRIKKNRVREGSINILWSNVSIH